MCLEVPITAVVGLGALYFRERNLFRLHNLYNKSYLQLIDVIVIVRM